MSRPDAVRAALLAACALLASCASAPVVPPAGVEYRPAQRSALVTRGDLTFLVARWQKAEMSTTLLARRQGTAAPRPVAQLMQRRQGQALFVAVQHWPEPWISAGRASHALAGLEQLYSLLLRQEPQARYCLSHGTSLCDAERDGMSHSQVLKALAGLREQAVGGVAAAVPWQVVEIQPAPSRSRDADVVGVHARSPRGPLEDVGIYFDRAPHSICSARTGVDGVASCRLQDQKDDGHLHDHATAVVATFPGVIRPDRVLLPTTLVVSSPAVAALPGFARPIPFPAVRP